MIKNKLLLILLIALTSLSSCKEENTNGGNHLYTLNERLFPLLFKTGSYWIYKMDGGESIDTLIVKDAKIDTIGPFNVGDGYTSTDQVYYIGYSSSINGDYSNLYVGYAITLGSLYGGYLYLSSHTIGDSSVNAKIVDIYDSILVNSVPYKNVVKMDLKEDYYLKSNLNYYYADSVGIIKKEIKESGAILESWSLIKYSVTLVEMK